MDPEIAAEAEMKDSSNRSKSIGQRDGLTVRTFDAKNAKVEDGDNAEMAVSVSRQAISKRMAFGVGFAVAAIVVIAAVAGSLAGAPETAKSDGLTRVDIKYDLTNVVFAEPWVTDTRCDISATADIDIASVSLTSFKESDGTVVLVTASDPLNRATNCSSTPAPAGRLRNLQGVVPNSPTEATISIIVPEERAAASLKQLCGSGDALLSYTGSGGDPCAVVASPSPSPSPGTASASASPAPPNNGGMGGDGGQQAPPPGATSSATASAASSATSSRSAASTASATSSASATKSAAATRSATPSATASAIPPPPGTSWTIRTARRAWTGVYCSADATKMLGVQGSGSSAYKSLDSGVTWTLADVGRDYTGVSGSSTGNTFVTAAFGAGLYLSTDQGASFNALTAASNRDWVGVAMSANGNKIAAAATNDQIYVSTDGGTSFTAVGTTQAWSAIAMSGDGSKIVATVQGGEIYVSTNDGATWVARDSARDWASVAVDSTGTKMVASVKDGYLYVSTDGGTTWIAKDSIREWAKVDISDDGTLMIAADPDRTNAAAVGELTGQVYVSTDSGMTWTARGPTTPWNAVAVCGNTKKLVAAGNFGVLATSF